MHDTYPMLINNTHTRSASRATVSDPYSGEAVADVFTAAEPEIAAAVDAAERAFERMRVMPAYERADLLRRASALIRERGEDLARTISRESGKPITAARGEVGRAVITFSLSADEALRMGGEVLPLDMGPGSAGRIGITRRFPLGPILAITPFNFPLNLVAHKVAPALAAGNTVVHKPSSSTPLTALKLGDILVEAGMPAGAVNVVPCPAPVAQALLNDERIRMVSFTGSPDVGWRLKALSGKKKVSLELGGNAGAVVEPDADLDLAVKRCAFGGYANSGQVCISLQRIYVHESVYGEFRDRFVDAVQALAAGDPQKDETVVGPLITAGDVERVHEWVEEARALGGRVLAGGSAEGPVYLPTVLENVPAEARCVRCEVFGPVTVLFPYGSFDQALREINNTVYGLQAGVFTRDAEKIFRAFNRCEVGGVMVNEVPTFRVDNFPYGGIKNSGFGREGVQYAMEEMTEIKVMVIHNSI